MNNLFVVDMNTTSERIETNIKKSICPRSSSTFNDIKIYDKILSILSNDDRYYVTNMREFGETNRKDKIIIGLRHDVDVDIITAEKMVKIEAKHGFGGSYYILATNRNYYGVFSNNKFKPYNVLLSYLKRMQDNGAEIGIHNDLGGIWLIHDIHPIDFLENELSWLRSNGIKIHGSSSHSSYYAYGISNYEVLKGMSIDGRKKADIKGNIYQLGFIDMKDFGLEYEANYILDTYLVPLKILKRYREKQYRSIISHTNCHPHFDCIVRDYDAQIGIFGKDFWLCIHKCNKRDAYKRIHEITTNEVIDFLKNLEPGKKIVLDSHPIYFSRLSRDFSCNFYNLLAKIKNFGRMCKNEIHKNDSRTKTRHF